MSRELRIDLNADLGEQPGSNLDAQIMPFLSSCNIACGGHAGDKNSVKETITLANRHQVATGAHPGYPDKENFGRKVMVIEPQALYDSMFEQISLINDSTETLHHVKPHGALYNHAAKDSQTAHLIVDAICSVNDKLILYGLPGSELQKAAVGKLEFSAEGFADRQYESDLSLRSRQFEDALLTDEAQVLEQVRKITIDHQVSTANGDKPIKVDTLCLHSDTPGAINLAKAIRYHLESNGVTITSV